MRHLLSALLLVISLLLVGCPNETKTPPPSKGGGGVHVSPDPAASPLYRKTTTGSIAVNNMNSRINGLMGLIENRPGFIGDSRGAVDYLLTRASFLGSYRDFDDAVRVAEDAVKAHPKNPVAWLMRAQVRAHLHDFDGALADCNKAESLKGDPAAISARRASIWLAREENLDEVLAMRKAAFEKAPGYGTAVDLGSIHLVRGEWSQADALYDKGLELYADVSPFAVSWVFFQKGVMWAEHAGQPEKAPRLYREAADRLPVYTRANVHLAELEAEAGDVDGAIWRLRRALETTEDPEPFGKLAELLEQKGEKVEAAKHAKSATERYDVLLEKYPLAFADHGTEFFLGPGKDPQRALKLAQLNLRNRKNDRAYKLVIEAALAAGDEKLACATTDQALQRQPRIADLFSAARDAYTACGRSDDAAKVATTAAR